MARPGVGKETRRQRPRVNHTLGVREWARDDGNGLREVHINTIEGLWTAVRNFVLPFHGISNWFVRGYLASSNGRIM
jgi:transposase